MTLQDWRFGSRPSDSRFSVLRAAPVIPALQLVLQMADAHRKDRRFQEKEQHSNAIHGILPSVGRNGNRSAASEPVHFA